MYIYTSHHAAGLPTQEAHSSTSAIPPNVNLTFVPDTAVAKIVTKNNQEAMAAASATPVIDRRTVVMEQRKETFKDMPSSNEVSSDVQDMEVDRVAQVMKDDDKQAKVTEHEEKKCTTSTLQPETSKEKHQELALDSSDAPGENTEQITLKQEISNANGKPKINDNVSTSSQVAVKQESKPDNKEGLKVGECSMINIVESEQGKAIVNDIKGPFFRLGMEDNFSGYVNHFATDPLALNRQQHLENKERRRAVSNKFSVFHEFKLSGEIFGPKDVILTTLRCSIVNLENNIPAAFMHPVWPIQRSTWVRAVHLATTPVEFAAALCFLEGFIKPVCFLPVWNDSLGHTELHRAIVETKAEKKKREHKEEEEDVDYRDRVFGK